MSATIYDIAEKANVSIATVSRVFNGHARVSARTRARVFEVAHELNYRPNASARSLARQNTHLISAVIPMLANYFFIEVIRGIQDALAESEFELLVYSAPSPDQAEGQIRRAIERGRSEATLLFSTPLNEEQVRHLKRSRQPVVLVDSTHTDFDSVAVDSKQGGYAATEHLIEARYQRIGLIMGHPVSVPALERRRGYEEALQAYGHAHEEALIVASSDEQLHGYTEAFGYTAMKTLLDLPQRPDAVFATSDTQALGALEAVREAGLKIPDEIGVVGFDDIMISRYVGLSTLRQPMYQMGKVAIGKLLARMKEPGRAVSHTVFSPELIVRETSGGVRAAFSEKERSMP